jgi:hypothetical protein
MGHLEDPRRAGDLVVARAFDLGITGPPLSISMDFIAGGLMEMIGGLACAAVLDAKTEHALFERYVAAQGRDADGRVTLLVSHRFSTVRMADLIVVMDGRASSKSVGMTSCCPGAGRTRNCTAFRLRDTGDP